MALVTRPARIRQSIPDVGILKHLLFWPVTGPAALVRFSMRQVDGVVRKELTDDTSVKEDLMALQMQLELGDIDMIEYEVREQELMRRLREARKWRVELGMEEEWAPLEFRDPPPPPPTSPPTSEPDSSSS